jgi:glycosyltransferase involved in cell wall biosynthesis
MTKGRVAIAISIYNKSNLDSLISSIDSMLNQSYEELDIILYIDGTIDDSLYRYIKELKEYNNIFIISSIINKGLGFGLNTIIDFALSKKCYKYLARMDGDDISLSHRIKKQVNFLDQNRDIDVCGTAVTEFGSSFAKREVILPLCHDQLVNYSIYRCPFIHPTVMFRMEIFKSGARYPTNYVVKEDLALWYKLILNGAKFGNLPEKLLSFRIDEFSLKRRHGFHHAYGEMSERIKFMNSIKKKSIKNYILILLKFFLHLLPTSIMGLIYKYFR